MSEASARIGSPAVSPPLLAGARVVEFSQLIAAPFCGLTLGDLGAEVIKVEPPGGDPSRAFGPWLRQGESGFFHALNRGKRGVELDLSEPADRELGARLVDWADVVVENTPGLTKGLGVTYEQAATRNPRLVWCSITGRGTGRGGRAADPSLQAGMGIMSLTGEPDGPPLRVPVPLVDYTTGLYAAQSVLAALWSSERNGRGAHLDCALVDAAATLTGLSGMLAAAGGLVPRRIGGDSHIAAPSGIFEAGDGEYLQLTCLTDRHWRLLCEALDLDEQARDPNLARNENRLARRDAVNAAVGGVLKGEHAEHWVDVLGAAGLVCERVRDIAEAWADPVLAERGLVGRIAEPGLNTLPIPVVALAGARDTRALPRGPRLGEHTEEVARRLAG